MIDQQNKAQNSPRCRSFEEIPDDSLWSRAQMDGESKITTAGVESRCIDSKMIITPSSADVHATSDSIRYSSPKSIQPLENDGNSEAQEEEALQEEVCFPCVVPSKVSFPNICECILRGLVLCIEIVHVLLHL